MSAKGLFEKVRRWIDGEEEVDEQGQPQKRSKWDDFLVAVAREIEAVMQRELFTPPGGPTYIPREYIVFLNPDDDAEWQGEKREGLQRGLHYVLSERAKALAGDSNFQTRSFAIELRVDAGLERNRFRVQPVWDVETERTMVQPRKRRDAEVKRQESNRAQPIDNDGSARSLLDTQIDSEATADEDATRVRPRKPAGVVVAEDAEATIVKPRKPPVPLFTLGVRRQLPTGDTTDTVEHPFYKDEITIGRGSAKADPPVDLRLESDMEISRVHARLKKTGDGEYEVTCTGANPILLDDGRELAKDESAALKPGEKVTICSYELAVQKSPDDKGNEPEGQHTDGQETT